ncbi:vWA domain-containing protein [Actinoplanes sp. NBRC 103695]|uniref:vWA domain-containing protein n=1 Tax=Actinoplanes sp. NBRC 103695 TaxID=3032202 RepID=UPI0024A49F94|nr:vWA domain-containing protein [Actinoplanes sp. NBRC 103695]GLY97810.1 hypothetical protein Acsp02_50640 [Actinoplanes sp. NBRC 103695]
MIANSRRRHRAVAASLAAAVAAASALGPAGGGPAVAAPGAQGEVQPIRLVIAVDESGSLTPEDVEQERIAAASVAMSELSPKSEVTVFGFGSNTGGVSAVDSRRFCTLDPGAAAQDREEIGACVQRTITRRAKGKGDNTDFGAALNQGIGALTKGADDGRPRMLLLLTDGKLDVTGDTNFAGDPETQNRYAEDQIRELVLPKARAAGVQIWPIGFGAQIDRSMLDYLAANGGRTGCQGQQAAPAASAAPDASTAVTSMMDAFVKARCLAQNRSPAESLPGGETLELEVTVPVIATDGAINVVKGDPTVKVTYLDPKGREVPAVGELDDSTFELAGTTGMVESMRIRNPVPGTWRIRLKAPDDVAKRMVSATALWQGVLRTVFVLDPPSPRPGERFAVIMRPHTRSAGITDPAALKGMSFSAALTGAGVKDDISLADGGVAPDIQRGDAYFSAWFTLPADAAGRYRVVGRATGPGVTSDQRETTFEVGVPGEGVRLKVLLDAAEGRAGDEIRGRLLTTNEAAQARKVRVVWADQGREVVTVPAPGAVLAPGSGQTDFAVRIADGAPAGRVGGVVQLVDAGTGTVLANAVVDLEVLPPPSLWPWLLGALLLIIAVVLVIVAVRARRAKTVCLNGVRIALAEDDQPLQPVLTAPSGPRFEFDVVVPDNGDAPTLRRVTGGRAYRIERAPAGGFLLRVPDGGAEEDLRLLNGAAHPLPNHPRLTITATSAGAVKLPKNREPVRETDPDDVTFDFEPVPGTRHDDDL